MPSKYLDNLRSVLRDDADISDCRELLRHGSHSFFAASLLLPSEYCRPITALYAFCRIADDAIDQADDPQAGLEGLQRRLDRIYANNPGDDPVDRAFANVVHRHGVPYALPAALLEGFHWDVTGRRYDTLSGTYAYSTRVAGTVGAMMAILMGARDPEVLSRACDLGVAMQLTNISRDVGEDARAGRIYLPLEMLAANGVDVDEWLADPVCNDGIRRTVQELLQLADELYARSAWGISQLPMRARPAMFAARSIYAEIGREVERNGCDSINQRAVVPLSRKLRLLGEALRRTPATQRRTRSSGLRETRFLIDAVVQAS